MGPLYLVGMRWSILCPCLSGHRFLLHPIGEGGSRLATPLLGESRGLSSLSPIHAGKGSGQIVLRCAR